MLDVVPFEAQPLGDAARGLVAGSGLDEDPVHPLLGKEVIDTDLGGPGHDAQALVPGRQPVADGNLPARPVAFIEVEQAHELALMPDAEDPLPGVDVAVVDRAHKAPGILDVLDAFDPAQPGLQVGAVGGDEEKDALGILDLQRPQGGTGVHLQDGTRGLTPPPRPGVGGLDQPLSQVGGKLDSRLDPAERLRFLHGQGIIRSKAEVTAPAQPAQRLPRDRSLSRCI